MWFVPLLVYTGLIGLRFANEFIDIKSKLKSDTFLKQFSPEEQEVLVQQIRREYGNTIDKEAAKKINNALQQASSHLENYANRRTTALAEVNSHLAPSESTQQAYDSALQHIQEDLGIFGKLVNDIGKTGEDGQVHHATDLYHRAFALRQKVSQTLQRQYEIASEELEKKLAKQTVADHGGSQEELDKFKDRARNALKTSHDEVKEETMKSMTEAITELQNTEKQQFVQDAFIARQKHIFDYMKNWKKEKTGGNNVTITTGDETSTLEMDGVDLSEFPQLLEEINADIKKNGGKPLEIKTPNNGSVTLARQADGKLSIKAEIPWNFVRWVKFWNYIKQDVATTIHTQIETAIALGMLKNGGGINLNARHDNPEEANDIAMTQYLTALKFGLSKDQFDCYINGSPKSHDEIEKLFHQSGRSAELEAAKKTAASWQKRHETRQKEYDNKEEEIVKLENAASGKEDIHKELEEKYQDLNKQYGALVAANAPPAEQDAAKTAAEEARKEAENARKDAENARREAIYARKDLYQGAAKNHQKAYRQQLSEERQEARAKDNMWNVSEGPAAPAA